MDPNPYGHSEWPEILQMLKSDEEWIALQGVTMLQQALAYAQEQQMAGFQTEQFMDCLCKHLNNESMTDLGDDIKYNAVQCLTNLIDLFPNVVNHLVNAGLIKGLTNSIRSSFNTGFQDLTLSCIRAFEKVVPEAPGAVLRSGAMPLILQSIDFFDSTTQNRVFQIILKFAGTSQSEQDFNEHLVPMLPMLAMALDTSNVVTGDQKKLEDTSRILFEIQESFFNFIGPRDDRKKFGAQFQKLSEQGIYNMVLEHIRLYAQTNNKDAKMQDEMQINSAQASVSRQFMLNIFRMLENASRFSLEVNQRLFTDQEFMKYLCSFLPSQDASSEVQNAHQYSTEEFPFVADVIAIFSALLADKPPPENEEQDDKSPHAKMIQMERLFEAEKRKAQLKENSKIALLAQELIPKLFFVYEATINANFRIRTLALIDKTLCLFDNELLKSCIKCEKSFAHFIYQIIRSKHIQSIEISLQTTRKLLDVDANRFSVPMIREGVVDQIKSLSNQNLFKKAFGLREEIDVTDSSFDLEVHTLKETLAYLRVYSPDDHTQMESCQRKLAELTERQRYRLEDNKKDKVKSTQLLQLFEIADGMIKTYFENQKFMEQLEEVSVKTKGELNLMNELTKLADRIKMASSEIQDSIGQVKQILGTPLVEVRQMIVGDLGIHTGITGHEFKQSGLLEAFELFLTKTPRQIKQILLERAEEKGEKHSSLLDWAEPSGNKDSLNEREGRCVMNRLKIFAHLFLQRVKGKLPMKALIELSHSIISESDSVFSRMPTILSTGLFDYGLPGFFLNYSRGKASSNTDYDHYINSLRHLQRRVTIQMIYDPKKSFLDKPKPDQQKKDEDGDSLMEDLSKAQSMSMKKNFSVAPELQQLAGSPKKEGNLAQSKVQLLRHCLYRSMKQSYVAVEQSSCMQVLEDFLRNQVKSMDDVKRLKQHDIDSNGLLGMYKDFYHGSSSAPRASVRVGNFFELALENMAQSMSQKMLRKSLTNGARKMLDSFNRELVNICKIGLRGSKMVKKKRVKKDGEEDDKKSNKSAKSNKEENQEMKDEEEVKDKEKEKPEEQNEKTSQKDVDMDDYSEEQARYEIELYEKYGEDADEGESDSHSDDDDLLEAERHAAYNEFKESAAKRIKNSNLGEDQQLMLIKLMSRQHSFLIGYLHSYAEGEGNRHEDEDGGGGAGEDDESGMLTEDEVYLLQCRIDDFQQCMEEVEEKYLILRAGGKTKPEVIKELVDEIVKDAKEDKEQKQEEEVPKETQQAKEDEGEAMEEDLLKQEKKAKPEDEDKEMTDENQVAKSEKDKEMAEIREDGNINLLFKELTGRMEASNENPFLAKLKRQQDDADRKIDRVMRKERELMRRLVGRTQDKKSQEVTLDDFEKELVKKDLEDLIKDEGEDVDFQFYFEGRPVANLSRTLFEMVRESESKRRATDKSFEQVEQLRVLQEKEEELARKARELNESSTEANREEIQTKLAKLKQEVNMIRSIFETMQREMGKGKGLPPPRFLGGYDGGQIYKLYFCIKDKVNPSEKTRARLDSLAELTGSGFKIRNRTKSEAIKDISSESIDKFVTNILETEFKVFEDKGMVETEVNEDPLSQAFAKVSDQQAPEEKKASEALEADLKSQTAKAKPSTSRREMEKREHGQLEKSLKLLKVMSFLAQNSQLLSEQGMQFLMKGEFKEELQKASPSKQQPKEVDQVDLTDLALISGLGEIQALHFYHPKLDLHLQKSLKDPINLVTGISATLQQIFANCSFLFPFSTKQLYFRLVSFISSIDAQRSIYFLQQHLNKNKKKQDDNVKKISRQKVQIQRDRLIQSAQQVMRKIDKRAFLEIEFHGEEGTGLGPTLEFYDNISQEFQDWSTQISGGDAQEKRDVKMWRTTNDGHLYPAPICPGKADHTITKNVYEVFKLCGQIVAKAIADDRQIDLPISSLFWKLCMGGSERSQLSLFDLKLLDEGIYKLVAPLQICANKVAEVEQIKDEEKRKKEMDNIRIDGAMIEDLCITFTYPGQDHIELMDDGINTVVTLETAQDYVDLVLHHTFHESVKVQIQAFKNGFNSVFPISSLQPFVVGQENSQEELETLVCGMSVTGGQESEWTSAEEQSKFIEPDHGLNRNSQQYLYFLRYMAEMPKEKRCHFVKFLTGSKRLPMGGFKALQPNLTLVLKKESLYTADSVLPSVMACQNYVKIPAYSSYEIFKNKFDVAVSEGQQNFTLS